MSSKDFTAEQFTKYCEDKIKDIDIQIETLNRLIITLERLKKNERWVLAKHLESPVTEVCVYKGEDDPQESLCKWIESYLNS